MPELNHHHLRLFWAVVKEGSVKGAARRLSLTQPTISGQLRSLEESLGAQLFDRSGGRMGLTAAGQTAFRYAEEIFALSEELQAAVRGEARAAPELLLGISDTVPKMLAHRLLRPLMELPGAPRLICREDRTERLQEELLLHRLDIALTDAPLPPRPGVRARHHRLGSSPLVWVARPDLALRLRRGFPASLGGAPALLPTAAAAVRQRIDLWLEEEGLRPRVVGEFDDSALMKTFGASGAGVLPLPLALLPAIHGAYDLEEVGRCGVQEEVYAISLDRRLPHPALAGLEQIAREVFRRPDPGGGSSTSTERSN